MKASIVTLFPELFRDFLVTSFMKKGAQGGALSVHLEGLREHGLGRHRSVDDTPYGGGSGMVLRVDCVVAAMESAEARGHDGRRTHRVLMTPQGRPLTQRVLEELSALPDLCLVCGRYEGFDDRTRAFVDDEVSLGDFVLTGGEVPAMALLEGVVRLLPGVLGNDESAREESFSPRCQGCLEYPQFTRPPEYRGHRIPEVLASGHHGDVAAYRQEASATRTRERRPELLELPQGSAMAGASRASAAERDGDGSPP